MKALRTQENFLLFEAYDIRFGKLDPLDINTETGEPIEKWGLYNEDGEVTLYAIDNDYEVVEFDPADKPEDYREGKYFYINGEFVLNPDWEEPPLPTEEQVKVNTENIEIVAESADESEAAICDLDEYYNEKIEELEARIAALEGRA